MMHTAKQTRDFKDLRRACHAKLSAVHGGKDRDALTLRDRLSELRGKPIHLVAMEMPGYSVNGMLISTYTADFVLYEARTTRAHQEHIIAHELAHILCGHQAVDAADGSVLRQLFPDIAPEVVRRALKRTMYSDSNEQEAEMIASVLLTRGRQPIQGPARLHSADGEVIARLRAAIAMDEPSSADAAQ
jgi:hypothetical protein